MLTLLKEKLEQLKDLALANKGKLLAVCAVLGALAYLKGCL